jgi:hypothetical protein
MKLCNVQHPILTEDHPLTRLLWLLFCVSIWALGFALSVLIIENLYFC